MKRCLSQNTVSRHQWYERNGAMLLWIVYFKFLLKTDRVCDGAVPFEPTCQTSSSLCPRFIISLVGQSSRVKWLKYRTPSWYIPDELVFAHNQKNYLMKYIPPRLHFGTKTNKCLMSKAKRSLILKVDLLTSSALLTTMYQLSLFMNGWRVRRFFSHYPRVA